MVESYGTYTAGGAVCGAVMRLIPFDAWFCGPAPTPVGDLTLL